MILWGPPGCGKTTLARIIANKTQSNFISYSAVISGIKQIKEVMKIQNDDEAHFLVHLSRQTRQRLQHALHVIKYSL